MRGICYEEVEAEEEGVIEKGVTELVKKTSELEGK